MAGKLPPTPVGVPPGHAFWNQWYEELRTLVNDGAVSVLWSNIDFTGSNITSIATRNHNNLQTFQGGTAGEYYHLTSAQYNRATSMLSKAGDPTTSDIASGVWAVYKNTSTSAVKLWVNDGGTLKSVALV